MAHPVNRRNLQATVAQYDRYDRPMINTTDLSNKIKTNVTNPMDAAGIDPGAYLVDKMRLCYHQGKCSQGDVCRYSHTELFRKAVMKTGEALGIIHVREGEKPPAIFPVFVRPCLVPTMDASAPRYAEQPPLVIIHDTVYVTAAGEKP